MLWGTIEGIGGHRDSGFQDRRRFLGQEVGLKTKGGIEDEGWMKKEDPNAWDKYRRLRERQHRSESWAFVLFPIICLILYSVMVYYEYSPRPVYQIDAAQQKQIEEAEANEAYELMKDTGYSYLRYNYLEAAQSQFEQAIQQRPTDVDAHLGLVETLTARCVEQGEACSEAATQLKVCEELPSLNSLQVKRLKVASNLLNDSSG